MKMHGYQVPVGFEVRHETLGIRGLLRALQV